MTTAESTTGGTRRALESVVLGHSLVADRNELEALVAKVIGRQLLAQKIDRQADGDTRFWAVDETESAILARLTAFGRRAYRDATGDDPVYSFIMINYVDAVTCPDGSGGGWHRDSSRRQYKAFAYLTDVNRPSQGAFCFIPASNSRLFWVVSMAYRLIFGGNRYSDRAIRLLTKMGFSARPVLQSAGVPFFLNTSLIHRGLRITEGHRITATMYIFEDVERMSEDFKVYYQASCGATPRQAAESSSR
jgi:hypothetical protein